MTDHIDRLPEAGQSRRNFVKFVAVTGLAAAISPLASHPSPIQPPSGTVSYGKTQNG